VFQKEIASTVSPMAGGNSYPWALSFSDSFQFFPHAESLFKFISFLTYIYIYLKYGSVNFVASSSLIDDAAWQSVPKKLATMMQYNYNLISNCKLRGLLSNPTELLI